MSNNIDVTPGTGKTVATEDISGAQFQRVKLAVGTTGTDDGDVSSSNPIPVSGAVSFTAPQHVVVDSGTLTAVTAITNVVHVDDNSGSLTVDGAISFTAPQHVIIDSGTVTTVSTVSTITNVVHVDDNSGSLTVDGTVAVSALSGTSAVKGGTASDAALANAPVTIGGRATNTNLAEMSTDGDVVDLQMTMQGALVTAHAPRELIGIQQTQLSNTTTETTIITAGASGIFNDLYGLILANTGGSTSKVTIKDATSGTTRAIIEVPTLDTRGFMLPAASAIPQASAANNWTATCGTATTAMEVTAIYIKRK